MRRLWPSVVGVAAVAGYAAIWLLARSLAGDFEHYLLSLHLTFVLWPVLALPYLVMAIVTIGAVIPVGAALVLLTSALVQPIRPDPAEPPVAGTAPTCEYRVADLLAPGGPFQSGGSSSS